MTFSHSHPQIIIRQTLSFKLTTYKSNCPVRSPILSPIVATSTLATTQCFYDSMVSIPLGRTRHDRAGPWGNRYHTEGTIVAFGAAAPNATKVATMRLCDYGQCLISVRSKINFCIALCCPVLINIHMF